jgi:hypothetical protein
VLVIFEKNEVWVSEAGLDGDGEVVHHKPRWPMLSNELLHLQRWPTLCPFCHEVILWVGTHPRWLLGVVLVFLLAGRRVCDTVSEGGFTVQQIEWERLELGLGLGFGFEDSTPTPTLHQTPFCLRHWPQKGIIYILGEVLFYL